MIHINNSSHYCETCDDEIKHALRLHILINMRQGSPTKLRLRGQTAKGEMHQPLLIVLKENSR